MSPLNRIAYIDLEGRLFTVAPDGTDARLLSESNRVFQFPAWSPTAPYIGESLHAGAGIDGRLELRLGSNENVVDQPGLAKENGR